MTSSLPHSLDIPTTGFNSSALSFSHFHKVAGACFWTLRTCPSTGAEYDLVIALLHFLPVTARWKGKPWWEKEHLYVGREIGLRIEVTTVWLTAMVAMEMRWRCVSMMAQVLA